MCYNYTNGVYDTREVNMGIFVLIVFIVIIAAVVTAAVSAVISAVAASEDIED